MANEYAVNQADLAAVADAIREKGGTSGQLVFPSGFVEAIRSIETGESTTTRMLYDAGNAYESVTGGWVQRGTVSDGEALGSASLSGSAMVLLCNTYTTKTVDTFVYMTTGNLIDLTPYSKIVFGFSELQNDRADCARILFGAAPGSFGFTKSWRIADFTANGDIMDTGFTAGEYEVDISGVSGSHYIFIELVNQAYSNNTALYISSVRLEP